MLKIWLRRGWSVAVAFAVTICSIGGLQAHDEHDNKSADDIEAHRRTDFGFEGFEQLNKQLQKDFEDFNFTENAAAYQRSSNLAAAADSYLVGQWSPVFDLPIVSIHNALLPNGKVLMWDSVGDLPTESYPVHNTTRAIIWDPATGGNSSGGSSVDLNAGVYAAELWNPATGAWRNLSAAQKTRQYHSMALLLPDGRVLTGGGGICGTCYDIGYLEKNIEMFSPPYLFKTDGSGDLAARPTITSNPTVISYRQNFNITTENPRGIRQAVLIRPASVTHSVDFEQRRIPLVVSASKRNVQVTSPIDAAIAPPGYYMLFIFDDKGVPSIAKMVKLG